MLKSIKRKSAKKHVCAACTIAIPIGVNYFVVNEVFNGLWEVTKWHLECREEFDNNLADNGEREGNPNETWENDMPEELQKKYREGEKK